MTNLSNLSNTDLHNIRCALSTAIVANNSDGYCHLALASIKTYNKMFPSEAYPKHVITQMNEAIELQHSQKETS